MIRTISIEGNRKFKKNILNLDKNFNCFIGGMRSGKTTMLKAIYNSYVKDKADGFPVKKIDLTIDKDISDIIFISADKAAFIFSDRTDTKLFTLELTEEYNVDNLVSFLDDFVYENTVVLIDEIGLHLFPDAQKLLIPTLKENFPNTQFIFSTLYPYVVGDLRPEQVFVLKERDNRIICLNPVEASFGYTYDNILAYNFEIEPRSDEIAKRIQELYYSLEKDTISNTREKLSELEAILKNEPEILRARMLLKRKELIGK